VGARERKTENALLRLPFKAGLMFRPGDIHPAVGEPSKTAWYRRFYAAAGWIFPALKRVFPGTSQQPGRWRVRCFAFVRLGASSQVLSQLRKSFQHPSQLFHKTHRFLACRTPRPRETLRALTDAHACCDRTIPDRPSSSLRTAREV
jgi:hypothetical protein